MLRKYSNNRTLKDNISLGVLTAITAGMVNVASLLIFFSFTSNVTGHYAILASEIVKGNLFQIVMVFSWILLFFLGGFVSNLFVINFTQKNSYIAHAMPILLEIACVFIVGFYCINFYQETLFETEILVCLLIFSMGLQNGLTASISNFAVKTTHLTGTTTDLGLLMSMFTKKKFRENKDLVNRAKLLISVMVSYLTGAVVGGIIYFNIEYYIFYVVCTFLFIILSYDFYSIYMKKFIQSNQIINLVIKDKKERRLSS
jgi:uncharacterized membrane protein YoaK (UPF0700 family)